MEIAIAKFRAAQDILTKNYKLDFTSIINMRRELHKYPEILYQEVKTKERLISYLKKCGAETTKIKPYAKTGFTYDIRGTGVAQGTNRAIGFRADMDALPMKELNALPYASVYPNAAHMCGHDGHMATLLAAAEVFLKHQEAIPNNKTIRLIFQPAEEGGHGGEKMVNEGALDNIDEVYALHSWSLPLGKVGIRKGGAMTTAMVRFRIDIQGKGSHGAYPENGKDPITAICQTHSALHTILSRGLSRKEFAVCTIGDIHGGQAENVIPDSATMGGSIRTHDKKVEEEIKRQIENIANFVPKAFGCEGKVRYTEVTPAVINAKEQAEVLRKAVAEVMGEDALTEDTMAASEDFSYLTDKVPGAFMLVGFAIPGKPIIMNHNPHFNFNEDLICPSVLSWIKLAENQMGFKFLKHN